VDVHVEVLGVLIGAEVGEDRGCSVFIFHARATAWTTLRSARMLDSSPALAAVREAMWRLGTTTMWNFQNGRVWWNARTLSSSCTTRKCSG